MMSFKGLGILTRPIIGVRSYRSTSYNFSPLGDKSAYTDKQLRQAHHIEESLEKKGVPHDKAMEIAWATVNKTYGGGLREKGGAHDKLQEVNPEKLEKELQDDGKIDRKKYVEEHGSSSREHKSNEDIFASAPPRNLIFGDFIKKGGRIISEHPNIRGEEYHTVVVELPDGHRQSFSNIKQDNLEKILQEQKVEQQRSTETTRPSRSRHLSLEEYIQQGGRIVSDHSNIRGQDYHTIVVELPNGRRQSFANVMSENLEKYLQQEQKIPPHANRRNPEADAHTTRYGEQPIKGHVALEDYIKKGGRIISEHPNIRGEEYHTVVVEMPNGRRQGFSNIKDDTLERILAEYGVEIHGPSQFQDNPMKKDKGQESRQ